MQCVLRNKADDGWELYEQPEAVLVANSPSEVAMVLASAERAALNKQVVGYVAYEAASAFDPALVTHVGDGPLAVFGIFNEAAPFLPSDFKPTTLLLESSRQYADYQAQLASIKQLLAAGDSYQVNLTHQLTGLFEGDPLGLFFTLYDVQPTPFAAFCLYQQKAIVSVSPELFFRLEDGKILTEPMKGTAPRYDDLNADLESKAMLSTSIKDRAENLMIVDMIRNDLGRICEPGSIEVFDLFGIKSLPTVWQQTSKVRASTRAGFAQIMQALFPCASITGAPKPRTMAIIKSLETDPRGVYTGAIGILRSPDSMQFSVAIRTLSLDTASKTARYGVGGGIVWDSDERFEWQETVHKSAVLNELTAALIETMRYQPEEGVQLWRLHLDRLTRSAKALGYRLNEDAACEMVQSFSSDAACKLRLLLTRQGALSLEQGPLPDVLVPVRLGLAQRPIGFDDLRLRHKTTARGIYQTLRGDRDDIDDVILWNPEGLLTESSIYNVYLENNGQLKTPRLKGNGLAGVYRQHLLDTGRASVADLTLEDLCHAERVWVSNAVRGLLAAKVIDDPSRIDLSKGP